MNHSSIDYQSIGDRLRAYRIAASLKAEDIAKDLKISRAAVYRLERGELVKIETLDRLARLLDVSVSALLGIDTEYHSTGDGFFERMRQLEQKSTHINAYFEPFSFLLTSPDYLAHYRMMLEEVDHHISDSKIASTLAILYERKEQFSRETTQVKNLISLHSIERFLHLGLIGTLKLSQEEQQRRKKLAQNEVAFLIDHLESDENIDVVVTRQVVPMTTFQIFYKDHIPFALTTSPFRLGELPNITNGIATVTNASDAIKQYNKLFEKLWNEGSNKSQGIQLIKDLLSKQLD